MGKRLPVYYDLRHLTKTPKRQRSKLLKLPTELIQHIFRNVKHPRDQVAFLLCCKRAARANSRMKLNSITVTRTGRAGHKPRPYAQQNLLHALQKWGFISKELRLCHKCETFLPRYRIWKTRLGKPLRNLEHVDWMWAVFRWNTGGRICPTCEIGDFEEGEDWLQPWPEGFARGALRRQLMEKC